MINPSGPKPFSDLRESAKKLKLKDDTNIGIRNPMQSISEMPIEYSPDPMPATTKQ